MNEYIYVINTSDKPLSFMLSDTIPVIKANSDSLNQQYIFTLFVLIIL